MDKKGVEKVVRVSFKRFPESVAKTEKKEFSSGAK